MRFFAHLNLRTRLALCVAGTVFIVSLVSALFTRQMLTATLRGELGERGQALAAGLVARSIDHLLRGNFFELHQIIQEARLQSRDIRYVFIVDPKGNVIDHTFEAGFPTDLLSIPAPQAGLDYSIQLLSTEEGSIRDIAAPILESGGVLHVGMAETYIEATVGEVVRNLLMASGLALLVGVALAWGLAHLIAQPILRLMEVAEAVRGGDLSRRASIATQDEVGRLGKAFDAMTEELQRKEEQRAQLLDKVISAQEEERQRIARELHDETGQAITSLMVGLRLAEKASTSPELTEQLSDLRALAAGALDEVRRLSLELRPGSLDDLGLVPTLAQYVRQFSQQHGVAAAFRAVGLDDERLPSPVELVVYRVAQEALTNVARHAQARHAGVLLQRHPGEMVMVVDDDGVGFDVAAVFQARGGSGIGLHGMQERAALVGGKLTVESSPGSGTTIYLLIPLS